MDTEVSTSKNMGKRITWLDALKGLAIFSVVLGHVLKTYVEANVFPNSEVILKSISDWIYVWHMPLFMFLSGYAFGISNSNKNLSEKECQQKRRRTLLNYFILYVVFSLAYNFLKVIFAVFVNHPNDLRGAIIATFFPNSLLWYLWALILYYLLFEAISRLKVQPGKIFIALLAIAYLAKIVCSFYSTRVSIRNFFCLLPFFYLGILLHDNYPVVKNIWSKKSFVVVALVYVLAFSVTYFTSYYAVIPLLLRKIMEMLCAFCMIFVLTILFSEVRQFGENRILVRLGLASLVIYLLSSYFTTFVKTIVIVLGFTSPAITVILSVIISIVLPYGIYYLSTKIKLLSYVFKPILIVDKLKTKSTH